MNGIGGSQRVQRNQPWPAHQQFACGAEQAIPDRLWRNAAIEQFEDFRRSLAWRGLAYGVQQVETRATARFTSLPFRPNFFGQFQIMAPGPICREVSFGRVLIPAAIQQAIRQRAQHRLGMLPTDRLQGAPAIRYVDRFMADFTEITHSVTAENFE